MAGDKKKISRNVFRLGAVSFLNDLSSEMIMPILPMFLTALGAGSGIVGLAGGIRDSLSSITKLLFGRFSDIKESRKSFIFSGYLVSALFKFLLGLSKVWTWALVVLGLERVGKGMRTAPRDALISESMPEEKGRAFGFHRAMDTAGAILGSLLAFLFFWFLNYSFKTIILIAAAFSFFSLMPLRGVEDKRAENFKDKEPEKFKVGFKKLSGKTKLFIVVAGIFALSRFSYMFFVLKSRSAFEGKLAVGIPILLYVLFNIFYAAFSSPLGKLSDKVGRNKVIIGGYLLYSVVCCGFALFNSFISFLVLFSLYGIVYAAVDANQRAYISDLSADDIRGTALGTFHAVTGIAFLPAGIIAGILWKISPAVTFYFGAAVSLFAVAAMALKFKEE